MMNSKDKEDEVQKLTDKYVDMIDKAIRRKEQKKFLQYNTGKAVALR